MLVVYALGHIFNTHKSVQFLYQMKAEIIFFYPEVIKICHFMKSLRINSFKTDAPYKAVHCRGTICKGSIEYFAWGPQEKFYRIFTFMMNIAAYGRRQF